VLSIPGRRSRTLPILKFQESDSLEYPCRYACRVKRDRAIARIASPPKLPQSLKNQRDERPRNRARRILGRCEIDRLESMIGPAGLCFHNRVQAKQQHPGEGMLAVCREHSQSTPQLTVLKERRGVADFLAPHRDFADFPE